MKFPNKDLFSECDHIHSFTLTEEILFVQCKKCDMICRLNLPPKKTINKINKIKTNEELFRNISIIYSIRMKLYTQKLNIYYKWYFQFGSKSFFHFFFLCYPANQFFLKTTKVLLPTKNVKFSNILVPINDV